MALPGGAPATSAADVPPAPMLPPSEGSAACSTIGDDSNTESDVEAAGSLDGASPAATADAASGAATADKIEPRHVGPAELASPFAHAAAEPATSSASLPSIRTASGAEDRAASSSTPEDGVPPAVGGAPGTLPTAEEEPAGPLTPPHSPPKAVYKPGDDDDTARTASVQAPASGVSSEAASPTAATSSPGSRVDRGSSGSSGRLPATVTASEAVLLAAAGPGCRAASAAGLPAAATPFAQAADASTVTGADAERAQEADSSSDGADDGASQPAQPKPDQFSMVIRNCRALGPRVSHSLAAAGGSQLEGVIQELLPHVPPPSRLLLGVPAACSVPGSWLWSVSGGPGWSSSTRGVARAQSLKVLPFV